MSNEKKFVSTWAEARDILKSEGLVSIETGGGQAWNNQVAQRLAREVGQPVVLLGEHPTRKGAFQYTLNLNSNQSAKVLLTKEDIR